VTDGGQLSVSQRRDRGGLRYCQIDLRAGTGTMNRHFDDQDAATEGWLKLMVQTRDCRGLYLSVANY